VPAQLVRCWEALRQLLQCDADGDLLAALQQSLLAEPPAQTGGIEVRSAQLQQCHAIAYNLKELVAGAAECDTRSLPQMAEQMRQILSSREQILRLQRVQGYGFFVDSLERSASEVVEQRQVSFLCTTTSCH
jgi:hypothetical protein